VRQGKLYFHLDHQIIYTPKLNESNTILEELYRLKDEAFGAHLKRKGYQLRNEAEIFRYADELAATRHHHVKQCQADIHAFLGGRVVKNTIEAISRVYHLRQP
jgi:hypothetical protein